MRIGILGCDAIRNELEIVTAGDPEVVYREYLEFGLHLQPDDLKKVILEKLDSLPIELDVVFLGYGYCQALKGLPQQVKVPVVMLEHEDCIAAMLTTERYHHEKNNGGVTWFYPAGWAVNGMPGMVKLFHLDCKIDEGYTPEFFLKMMFDGFSRCLFIDTGIECSGQCQKNSEEFAGILGLRHECTKGSLDLIREAWLKTKARAAEIERTRFACLPN
jgi:hypothetical protein